MNKFIAKINPLTVVILLVVLLPNTFSVSKNGTNDCENSNENLQEDNTIWLNDDQVNNDHFNLFNLFNVFRGTKSKLLDEEGNLIPLDASDIKSTSKKNENAKKSDSQTIGRSFSPFGDEFSAKPVAISTLPRSINFEKLKLRAPSKESDSLRKQNSPTTPVLMIPGYGGTRLEAKLNKPSVVRYFCDLKSDWTDIWINVKLLLPYMIDCLIDNLRLEYDPSTNTTKNTPGVEIRVKDPGLISSVEYLHQMPLSGFAYFGPIVDKLVESINYERELNIRGLPYDFRKAPNELADHFMNMKLMSEQLFNENGKKRVTYICHSMGCNQMLYFFQRQSQAWKDQYVRGLISLAAPWAGSFSALRAAAMGDDLGMPYLFSESKLIKVQRSLPSTIFLFPRKEIYSSVPLIRSNVAKKFEARKIFSNSTDDSVEEQKSNEQKLYTAENFQAFFRDLNHPDGYRMWLDTKDLLGSLEAPGVEVWCLVGRGQKTLGRMEFEGDFPNSNALELYDDGDGTVTLDSAKYCTQWSDKQKQPINYKEFYVSHMAILKETQVLEYIKNIISSEISTRKGTSVN